MSRIGRNPITIPAGVTVNINNHVVTVTGPKGTLKREISSRIIVKQEEDKILVINPSPNDKQLKALHGLFRQLINNMVEGVTKGYEKRLNINGVGYKVILKSDKEVVLHIGYSNPAVVHAVDGITLDAEKNTLIIRGIDKELVGQFASNVRGIKPVEPYHAYGISYSDEVIRRKETKTGKK